MVKGVQPSCVRPRVLGWVETLLGGRVGVYFTNEGKGAVEVRVPGDGANSQEGRGGQGRARVGEGLRTAPSDSVQSKSIRTTTGSYLERGRGGGGGGGKTDTLFESLARHRGRAARGRTGRERAALKDVERTPLRAATFFRAPAGSLASILGMSTSRSSSTRIFERASQAGVSPSLASSGRIRIRLPTNHSPPFCVSGQSPARGRDPSSRSACPPVVRPHGPSSGNL